jgi:putative endonuclease
VPTERTRLGTWGEQQASRFLEDHGYRIVATNYRCAYGEVDIVAQDGQELVFVEVRTRHTDSFVVPEESLSSAKVCRLVATCQDYLEHRSERDTDWRIDLVCVYVEPGGRNDRGRGRQAKRIYHLPHAVQL